MSNRVWSTLILGLFGTAAVCYADLPQAGDVVFGLSRPDPLQTMEIVRGPAVMGGGAVIPDPWNTQNFIQSVEFDNLGGIAHNYQGNLLAANFGASATGGVIYNLATTAEVSEPQVIGDFAGGIGNLGGSNVTQTRIAGLSISPDNSKVAVFGNDTGAVLVYDYTAGDTMGGGAALANARETGLFSFSGCTSCSQGTAWLDSSTVLVLAKEGQLKSVNATTMAVSGALATVSSPIGIGTSDFSSLLYNPEISDYVFGMISSFDGGTMMSQTTMYVFDPSDSFNVLNTIDLSGSSDTGREMAFDASGNLFLSQFGANIDIVPNAATLGPTLGNDSSIDWYTSTVASSFNGLDIGLGSAPTIDGDFDNNGLWNCADIDMLTAVTAAMTNDPNFDLNGDMLVNDEDISAWLIEGGANNPNQPLTGGNPFLRGDANLDGIVDGQDFIEWNENKFANNSAWCNGNFNGDALIDGQDFIIWNEFKFQSSAGTAAVPEPSLSLLILCGLAGFAGIGRRR